LQAHPVPVGLLACMPPPAASGPSLQTSCAAMEQVDPHRAVALHLAMFSDPAEFTIALTGNFSRADVGLAGAAQGPWSGRWGAVSD
jgi:hypothetical protein